jgi:hypothetical protein
MRRLSICLVLAGLCTPALAAKPKLAVLDVSASGIEPSFVPLLTEVLTVEVDNLGRYQVMSGSDVRALIGFEKQRDLLGCTEASCLAEIGGALGVDAILVGNIGRLGATYVVNIKLIDIRKAATLGRVYESVQGEIDVLLATIRTSVHKLFASVDSGAVPAPAAGGPPAAAAVKPGAATEPRPAVAAEPKPVTPAPELARRPAEPTVSVASSAPSTHFRLWTGPVVSWAVGGVALAAGAYFGLQAKSHYDVATDPTNVGRQTEIAAGKTSQLRANIAFGVGGAALAVGLGLFAWGGTAPATVAAVPERGGLSVLATLPFPL